MVRTHSRLFASLLAIISSGSGCDDSIPYIGTPDSSAIGTYELAFCRRSCNIEDSAAAVIRGTLVLDSVRIEVPDSQKEYFAFANGDKWAIDLRNNHPEGGCFALHEPGRLPVTTRGVPIVRDALIAVGLNNWRYRQDSTGLFLELYRSPDASFDIHAQISRGRLVGIASAGGELQGADRGIKHVAGQRIGDPRPSLCFAAGPVGWTLDDTRHKDQ